MLISLMLWSAMGWAQEDSEQTPASPDSAPPFAPAIAPRPELLIGLDQGPTPVLEQRSFLVGGVHIGENAASDSSQLSSITVAFGNLSFLSVRRHAQTAIDYLGGAEISNNASFLGSSSIQVHQLTAEHHMLWRRRTLTLYDRFSNLPGGDFGSAWFGGAGLYNLAIEGVNANQPVPSNLSNFFAASDFGGFEGSHINNVSLAEYREMLSPRSTFAVIGGYGFTDYSGTPGLINTRLAGTLVNYGHKLGRRDHIGFSYRFQKLIFPQAGAGDIYTNSLQLVYGHQISSRMSFGIGVGPQFVELNNPSNGSVNQINGGGNISLAYLLHKNRLAAGCDRQVTGGSGLFAGANTDSCQFSVVHTAHTWSVSLDAGYADLSPIGQISLGYTAQGYRYVFAGAAIDRNLGQHVSAFAGYQFNSQSFGTALCTASISCNQMREHLFSMGIDFRTRPRR